MVDCFNQLEDVADCAVWCYRETLHSIALNSNTPLAQAGLRLARDIDAGIGSGQHNSYHNRQHFCEVLLSTLFLGHLTQMPQQLLAQTALAALVHDFHHDGKVNGDVAFRLERIAADAIKPYLQEAGVPASEIERITVLVLATEVSTGVPYARDCYQRHLHASTPHPIPAGAEQLVALSLDPELARQAVLLAEADLLPSVGLTVAHSMRCQNKLADEWRLPKPRAIDKLKFLDTQVHPFLLSQFFQPNLHRLRNHLSTAVDQPL